MNNVSSIILAAAVSLLTAVVLPVQAQLVTAVANPTPCPEEQAPGRPTLKRRQSTSEGNESGIVANRAAQEQCEPNKVLRAVVRPIPVKFEGLVNVEESDLRHYISANYAEEARGNSAASYRDLNVITSLAKKFLQNSGYRHARVTQQPVVSIGEASEPVLVIEEGPRLRIAAYHFEGNRVFATSQLAGELGGCMTGYNRDYYDVVVFDYCLHQLNNFARSQGYAKAQFHDPKPSETEAGLIITVTADEGILYRMGNVKFDGDVTAPDQLPLVCPLKTGDIMNGTLLQRWLYDDLKRFYGEHGYIQYTADVTPEFRTTKQGNGSLDLVITIDTGKRFKVNQIKFAGANLPDNLAGLMLIHDGDIYNQVLFERSIETLNNTGLFAFIDKNKDVDFRENDEEGLVDIVIKLTRK